MATTIYTVVLHSEGHTIPFNEAYHCLVDAKDSVREHAMELGYDSDEGEWEDRDGGLRVCVYNNCGEICEYMVQACALK